MAEYARLYKRDYPTLRKRGVSAYSVFLMVIHGIIKRFTLVTDNIDKCISLFEKLLHKMSVLKLIRIRILRPVSMCHRLNLENWGTGDSGWISEKKNLKWENVQRALRREVYEVP